MHIHIHIQFTFTFIISIHIHNFNSQFSNRGSRIPEPIAHARFGRPLLCRPRGLRRGRGRRGGARAPARRLPPGLREPLAMNKATVLRNTFETSIQIRLMTSERETFT